MNLNRHAVMRGWVSHQRFLPRHHSFRYRLSMLCLDLDNLESAFTGRWFWSLEGANLASFRRADHLDGSERPLAEQARDIVAAKTGKRPEGELLLLTQPRYFGYVMNPISVYLCHDPEGVLQAIIAEVHNTPWAERHPYILPVADGNASDIRINFDKALHVSPFMPMNMRYRLRLKRNEKGLILSLESYQDQTRIFAAHMALSHMPMNSRSLNWALCGTPFMTGKIVAAIYWEALRLWIKRIPYIPHPDSEHAVKEST